MNAKISKNLRDRSYNIVLFYSKTKNSVIVPTKTNFKKM